jgi:hypothetical protein
MKIPSSLVFILLFFCVTSKSWSQNNTQIKFFGQPGLDFSLNDDAKSNSTYFRGGQFVIYVTSQITEKVTVAGELNIHYMAIVPGPSTEIERLYLRYAINDNLALRIGKTYNPIGYWNLNYNLGLVLQPTISRPLIIQPTHDGGFTQTRDIGVMLEGENIGSSRFFFDLFVANGRGKNGGLLGPSYALGKTISTTARVGIEPTDGLKLSVSGVFNPLEKGLLNEFGIAIADKLTYSAIAGSISFFNPEKKLELIAEYYQHTNAYETLGTYNINGGVLYLGMKTNGKVTPYFYGETLKFQNGDPFFPLIDEFTNQSFGDVTSLSLGLRYKFTPTIVFKTEAGSSDHKGYGTTLALKTQLAFSF